jgi:hypothetical protein
MNMTGLTYILVVLLFVTVVYFGYYGNVVREGFLTVGDASISAIPEDYRSATDKLLQVSSLKRRFGDLLTNVRPGSYSCKNPPTYPSVIVRLLKDAYWKERSEGERDGESKRVLALVARQCGEVKLIEEIVEKLDAKKDESEELTVTEFKGLTLDLVSF